MTKDPRTSRQPRSGNVVFAGGDSGTSKDLLSLADEETVSINDILVTYDTGGTTNAEVELYDDAAGTAAGSVSDKIEEFRLDPGDIIDLSDIAREDVEEDIIAVVRNNDDDVTITVGAYRTTG